MSKTIVGEPLCSLETVTRAFEYSTLLRLLYRRLLEGYQLLSVRTLTQITSRVGSVDDLSFLENVLDNLPHYKRRCVVL